MVGGLLPSEAGYAESAAGIATATGEIMPVAVDGLDGDFYVHHSLVQELQLAEQGALKSSVTTLLSPFDPVVWDRRRALELFDFDYRLECYTPKEKRQYGYFTLPVLQRGELIGRIDAKMHRRQGIFEIISFHPQAKVRFGKQRAQDLRQAITRSAKWHGAKQVTLGIFRHSWPSNGVKGGKWNNERRRQRG